MHQHIDILDKIPTPLAAVTSTAVVTNGAFVWAEGVTTWAGVVVALMGVPMAVLGVVYWYYKMMKAKAEAEGVESGSR